MLLCHTHSASDRTERVVLLATAPEKYGAQVLARVPCGADGVQQRPWKENAAWACC
jgi:hypothetical protein